MTQSQATVQAFGQVGENPVGIDRGVTVPVCEGLNLVYASFQALSLQYPKHHFRIGINLEGY